jgi:hypothetical protein
MEFKSPPLRHVGLINRFFGDPEKVSAKVSVPEPPDVQMRGPALGMLFTFQPDFAALRDEKRDIGLISVGKDQGGAYVLSQTEPGELEHLKQVVLFGVDVGEHGAGAHGRGVRVVE